MLRNDIPGLDSFLQDYPGMSIAPLLESVVIVKGKFAFNASSSGMPEIKDAYQLEIKIPLTFPRELPSVTETALRIPRDGNHHVNYDDTLCLGSPLRLRWKLSQYPTLIGFAKECLIPYLYSVSHKLKYGTFPFGELDHGKPGVISDYLNLLGLSTEDQVKQTLVLLGTKKRQANKRLCPCGCGKRLGACRFHLKINDFRKVAARPWFRSHLSRMGKDK